MAFTGTQASMRINVTWQKLIFVTVIGAAAVLVMVRNIERKASGERLFTEACYTSYNVYTLTSQSGVREKLHLSVYLTVSLLSSQLLPTLL